MVTLTERTIMKSRSGVYSDTSENRRKHRVGQKYGAEKQSDDGEKTEKKETDPAKELEAVNKVIAAINEGKLNLPAAEVMKLSEKKQKLEAAKNQAEKINAGVKANEEKKNAEEAKETSKKINEAQKKEASKKKYSEMDIKEARKELLGKKITFKEYFFDGVDSYKDAVGKISQVRLYGKEKQPVLAADFPNGDSIQISLKQLDERKASKYEIVFNEKVGEHNTEKKETEQKESTYEKADRVLREAPIGAEASGGGYGPFKKEKVGVWINKVTGRKFNGSLAEHIGGFSDFTIKKKLKEEVDNLQRRKELSEKVERLISEKKKKFPNPDIESPMSDEEKRLTKEIADTWSEINKLIQENRKSKEESKSESKQGETEESYTRVKFDDVPNSGKVNLKKYLSEKVRQGVDEKWSNIKNIPTDNLKKMEKGLVNDLNKNFEAIKKSQRAELLYSIMKVKGELESRGKETSKEGSKESGKLSDLQSKVPGYMNMPEYKKYISAKSEVDNFGKVPSGGDKRQRYDELNEQLVEATKKYKEALKKKLTT